MSLLIYFLKVSLALIVFYLLYILVFRRFTFFTFNRIYLLLTSSLSLVLPLITIPGKSMAVSEQLYSLGIDWDSFVPVYEAHSSAEQIFQGNSLINFFLLIYLGISLTRLFHGLILLLKLKHKYRNGSVHSRDGVRIIVHPKVESPFTLFQVVYLDPRNFKQKNMPLIRHEMVHARQLHSLDLLLSEIICSFLWINPFVFLFKRRIKENHEFLADYYAQADGEGLIPYMNALSIELSKNYDSALASYFKSSTLKKRILMLTDKQTNRKKRTLYLLLVPLIGFLAMAFQQPLPEVIDEGSLLRIQAGSDRALTTSYTESPSGFPMDEKYRASITAKYGKMKHPFTKEMKMHVGVDIAAPIGEAVYSTGEGTVIKSEMDKNYGNLIVIKHNESYSTLYAHMQSRLVETGDKVNKGQKIATNGTTGLSTGPHLHYEVRKNGENVDPEDYF